MTGPVFLVSLASQVDPLVPVDLQYPVQVGRWWWETTCHTKSAAMPYSSEVGWVYVQSMLRHKNLYVLISHTLSSGHINISITHPGDIKKIHLHYSISHLMCLNMACLLYFYCHFKCFKSRIIVYLFAFFPRGTRSTIGTIETSLSFRTNVTLQEGCRLL